MVVQQMTRFQLLQSDAQLLCDS